MASHDLPAEFELLLNRLLNSSDDEFSTDDFDRFQSLLLTNSRAMEVYFEYVDIHSGLQTDLNDHLEALEKNVPPSIKAVEDQQVPVRSRTPVARYFLVLSISFLSFLMLEWLVTGRFLWQDSVERKVEANPAYVATLTRLTDCVWGGDSPPEFSGQRLLTESLVLEQGIAEFRFDTGTRLIIEGPTKINLVTSCCAKLEYGKMVLHGYEASPEFSLITPRLTFHDIGTEYGARIHKDGEVDLHVFEGAVRVDPIQKNKQFADSIIIKQGEARSLTENSVGKIKLQPELFNREVPGTEKDLKSLQQELQVYDCFHPPVIDDPENFSQWQNAGFGWRNPWRKKKNSGELARADSHPTGSIARTSLAESQLGLIELQKPNTSAWRSLEKPIRLDTNAIYYLSFYMQQISRTPKEFDREFGNLSLQTTAVLEHPQKILFGMSSEGYATLQAGMQIVETAPPLETGKTYFFVAKIVASEKSGDQVFLRTYSEQETIPEQEPSVWTCSSVPFEDSNVFDLVRIQVGWNAKYLFDELRIGTTWASVIDPDLPRLILKQQQQAP